ncbi:PQ loop repeat-domain-containing protein [Naematelia encephala]|uniref:PQ loop repeat-domain-containing protein n=1 Tax=Naematelia encephala TaxID=71784 RepID=A0A1Y2AX86_9TREE|nr:PQ loop repeat-domain-containing protein [Naematelia encephala]
MLVDSISREGVANFLGYLSIACWLCAQFPQVVKNIALQSCDGLALPFLLNWLFGDITNLIGCVLTDQLPFQTYLAAYFCVVDFSLLAQFFYYRSLQLKSTTQPPSTTTHETTPRVSHYYTATPSIHQSLILPPQHTSHTSPRSRSTSHPGKSISTLPPSSTLPLSSGLPPSTALPGFSTLPPSAGKRKRPSPWSSNTPLASPSALVDNSYAAIYEAALDVARAAERAGSKHRRLSRQATDDTIVTQTQAQGQGMTESFHSEMSASSGRLSVDGRGRTLARIADVVALAPTPPDEEDEDDQERQLGQQEMVMRQAPRSKSRSLSLVRGSGGRGTGRRAAGVAFMSLGLLVSWSKFDGRPYGYGNEGGHGVVLGGKLERRGTWPATRYPQPFMATTPKSPQPMYLFFDIPPTSSSEKNDGPHSHPDEPPSFQRVIGRISAWTCTTLYLTSRLPQIWKNFNRKSIEGLSILLFVFAFMGNLTYVISILLNPTGNGDPTESAHYLLEALPYLLGSGGTLIFDLTIMMQSFIYGSSPPIPSTPLDRPSRKHYGVSRRRYRHLEDGRGISASSERQPLLSGHIITSARQRSLSPDVSLIRGKRKGGGALGLMPAPEEEERSTQGLKGDDGAG